MKEIYGTAVLAGIFGVAIIAGAITSYNGRTYVSPPASAAGAQSAQVAQTAPAAPAAASVDFAAEIQPILDETCVMCHQGEYAASELSLDAEQAPASLIGVASTQTDMPLVTPGAPEDSYFLHKIKGTHETVDGFGSQMPMGGELSVEQIELVTDWIAGLQ